MKDALRRYKTFRINYIPLLQSSNKRKIRMIAQEIADIVIFSLTGIKTVNPIIV
jgi:hypothetical protein